MALAEQRLDAAIGLDPNGAVLWVPFDDGPHYPALRLWLHELAEATIAKHPDVFTHGHEPDRVRVDVGSNATGRWSAWPYSIRGNAGLTMLTPVTWPDLDAALPASLGATLAQDVFASEVARIHGQRFGTLTRTSVAPPQIPLRVTTTSSTRSSSCSPTARRMPPRIFVPPGSPPSSYHRARSRNTS